VREGGQRLLDESLRWLGQSTVVAGLVRLQRFQVGQLGVEQRDFHEVPGARPQAFGHAARGRRSGAGTRRRRRCAAGPGSGA